MNNHRLNLANIVLCLGPRGTNAEQAASDYARAFLGTSNLQIEFCQGNDSALDDLCLDARPGAFAVVPIENSSEGPVVDTLRWWKQAVFGKRLRPRIVDEIRLPVRHCLAKPFGTGDFQKVISHPQALAQCSLFLGGHQTETRASTAAAAEEVSDGDGSTAAVCSEFTAECYGLEVVASNIQDSPDNETRFHVVSFAPCLAEPTGADRTALIIELENKPGAVHYASGMFAAHDVNVSMQQSLPLGPGRYGHYFEAEFHENSDSGRRVLKCLETMAFDRWLAVLGSYPRANLSTEGGAR